jgi:hypothetical protein
MIIIMVIITVTIMIIIQEGSFFKSWLYIFSPKQ